MRAAGRADAAGDTEAARQLVRAAVQERERAAQMPAIPPAPPTPTVDPVPAPQPVQGALPTFVVNEPEDEVQVVATEAELPGAFLPRQEPGRLPATFESPEETAERIAALVDERLQRRLEERDDTVGDVDKFLEDERERIEGDVDRQRGRMVIAGREDEPVEPTVFLPPTRPTRIQKVRERSGADGDFEGFLSEEVETLYRDPDTGELREPTAFEELFETFAAQPVMTEAEARARDDKVRRAREDVRRRIAAGEEVSFEEAQVLDPAMSTPRTVLGALDDAMKTEGETGGVYESGLGATLRSVPAFLSALAREGYFQGLGYEVDEDGQPIDPSDFGYKVAQAREALGIPAVLRSLPSGAGTMPAFAPLPLPGVAIYARRQPDTVGTDPEARRQRPDVDVPSILDDPSGWFEGEARRIARTISNDRGMGDDFVDAPELRAAYADIYGDPDAAFWGGSLFDVIIPAGPGTALRKGKAALEFFTSAAGESTALQKAADALITTAEVNNQTRAQRSFTNAAADVAAIVVPGRASEGRLVRKVADNVVDITPGLDDTQRAAMKAAVKVDSTTPEQVVRDMAKAIDRPVSNPDVQRLLTEVQLRTPDDMVMVSEAVAVPRKVAPQTRKVMGKAIRELQQAATPAEQAAILRRYEMPAYAKRVEEAGGLDKLDPRVQNVLREQVKTQAAYRAVPEIARAVRKADKVSEFQVYVERMAELVPSATRGAYGPLMRRIAAVYGSKAYKVTPVSVAKATRALQAAGASATREIKRALITEARTSRTAEEALDRVFARELGGENPDSLYSKILGDMYGGEKVPQLMRSLAVDNAALGGRLLDDIPSVQTLRRIDEHLVATGGVNRVGPGPEVERAMLRTILEEGVRKRRALGGKEFEAAIVADGTRRVDVPENVGGFFKVPERLDPAAGAPGSRLREYRVLADPATEGRLIEGTDELVKVLGNEPGLARLGWGNWLTEKTSRIAQGVRDAEYAMRYGYYLPNVPYMVGRAIALPIVSIATIGAENTMRALARSAGKAVDAAANLYPRSRRLGLGVVDPDGVYYSPKVLDDLLEVHGGLGRSAIDQARVNRIGRDIIDQVERTAGGRELLSAANPLRPDAVNFYQKTAEAIELSYRRSVFESAIAHGILPSDAALLARESLLNLGEVPSALTNTLGTFFVDAGEKYLAYLKFAGLAVRNPQQITRAAKATRLEQKRRDPYGLEGDRTLRALGIVPVRTKDRDTVIYGPESPHTRPIEQTLDILRTSEFTVRRLAELVDRGLDAKYSGALDAGLEGAGELVRYGASELLPGVLDALEKEVGPLSRGARPGRALKTFDDEEAFWVALLAADYADPRHESGVWQTTVNLLDPKVVMPPAGLELDKATAPDIWTAQPPEGTPFIALGLTRDGVPRYKVFEPSKTGLRNLRAIRSATPDLLEQALGAGASLYGSSDNVDVDALFPEGATAAVGRFVGAQTTPAAERDPRAVRAKQTEAIRGVREDVVIE